MNPCQSRLWPVLVALAGLVMMPSASARILRVKSGVAAEAPDGSSWTNAFPRVTEALVVAQPGDEVWVAAGTYPGSLTLNDGIALYGGFEGVEETREQRNFNAHISRLDGGGTTNLIVVANGAGPATRIDGFTIQHGRAGGSSTAGSGGGVRVLSAEPVIANNQFLSNNCIRSGGAVYLENSAAVVTNNYFGFNGTVSTARDGGGLAAIISSPTVQENSFVGNRGRDGGAVHFTQSTGFLIRNSMLNNTATRDGGGVFCSSSSPQITHNRFLGNAATDRGGGVVLFGGSASLLFNNVFTRNTAGANAAEPAGGGGVFSDGTSQPRVLNNTLVMNRAPVGGLLVSNRNATVVNNIVAFGSSGIGGDPGLRLQTNNVFGNAVNYTGIPDPTGSQGNISVDPKFAGDISLAVVNILPSSPCRDVGNAEVLPPGPVDLDGEPRVQGAGVDLGADETDGVTTYFLPLVVRVAPDGNDNHAGAAWDQPKRTVQAAIEFAGRRGGEVWVKAGTYPANLILRPFTSLYAGFTGTETNRSERNWLTHQTVLDGNRLGSVIELPRLEFDEAVDGFVIRNGAAVAGGGILAEGKVWIVNNRFLANEATTAAVSSQARGGGAVYLVNGEAFVANNLFAQNRATSENRSLSAEGGAIKIANGSPTIANNLFRMNVATNGATSGFARGGALVVTGPATPRVVNNTFLQNYAWAASASATYERGGALSFEGTISAEGPAPLLVNNLVAYNSSGVAGRGQPPQVYNNLVWGSMRANYEDLPDYTGTNGNLSLPPRLTGPYGDPHLTADSPARDAGDDSLVRVDWRDLDGKARVVGDAPDIGADEFDGTTYEIADRIFYVKPDGSDSNDGASWSSAKQTVGAGLEAAALEGGEVWVQTGLYAERVRVELFTYLFGGFKGDETRREARNWFTQPSVLDGGASPTQPVAGNPVVTVTGTDGYATVDGLTIQNGAAQLGAGLNVFGSALIAHNLVRSNLAVSTVTSRIAAGGGLYCEKGSPSILNNLFVANRATNTARASNGLGGAIYLDTPSGQSPALLQNTVLDNQAYHGGGVFLANAARARIANNIVAFGSSGLYAANATNTAGVNCVFGNAAYDYRDITPAPESLSSDPRFVDWRAGNYRLRADSPCLDRGDAAVAAGTLDIFAEPRLAGSAPELGADEFSGPAAADFNLTLSQPLPGSVHVAPATVFLSADVTGGATAPDYIEYVANNEMVALGSSEPFSAFAQDLVAGDYSLLARAITAAGAMATSAPVAIKVLLPPNNEPPTVSFTAPTNGQEFRSPADVRASFRWSKANGSVVRWELLSNGALVASDPAVPSTSTSASVTVPDLLSGDYQLTVVVSDNVGTKGTNEVAFVVGLSEIVGSTAQPPKVLADGSVQIEFNAPTVEADYVLERTTDLVGWTPVSTNSGGAPIQLVIPPNSQFNFEAFRTRGYYP